jgi:hypothetical protein
MKSRNAPVVLVRKDKRIHKGLHLFAFMATGGISSLFTILKTGTNSGYNRRTRQLQERANAAYPGPDL